MSCGNYETSAAARRATRNSLTGTRNSRSINHEKCQLVIPFSSFPHARSSPSVNPRKAIHRYTYIRNVVWKFLSVKRRRRRRRDAIRIALVNRMRSHLRRKRVLLSLHAYAVTLHKICALRPRETLKINDTFYRNGQHRRHLVWFPSHTIRAFGRWANSDLSFTSHVSRRISSFRTYYVY